MFDFPRSENVTTAFVPTYAPRSSCGYGHKLVSGEGLSPRISGSDPAVYQSRESFPL